MKHFYQNDDIQWYFQLKVYEFVHICTAEEQIKIQINCYYDVTFLFSIHLKDGILIG